MVSVSDLHWSQNVDEADTCHTYRGFNDVTAASSSGAYYQVWSGKTGTVNTGANGLGKFDYVIQKAKASNIKLIVAL